MTPTYAERLATFVARADWSDLSAAARQALKIRILDALGCAIGAVGAGPMQLIRDHTDSFGGRPVCTLIGSGATAPDRAAFYNGALVRYLDFNDSYLAKGETCHPSDALSAVLAGAEYAQCSGRELQTALAVAYQVQCRLSDVAPVRAKGFDHTTQGAYAVAAGVAKALRLNPVQIANAVAICGTAFNALRVTRTGKLSHWKGLAYPNTAFGCVHATFLAMRGVTGPLEVFEGNKGFMQAISGSFDIDWSDENLERVTQTILKRYNAEVHSQAAIEGLLELKHEQHLDSDDVEHVEVEIFDVAYRIIGGGEEGDKHMVQTKEQADHSLPYVLAVALLDDDVMPAQYHPERIQREDVQGLMRKIVIRPSAALSERFPREMPCRIAVALRNGRVLVKEKNDYAGFIGRPLAWSATMEKFQRLSGPACATSLQCEIADAVAALDDIQATDLTRLLAIVQGPPLVNRRPGTQNHDANFTA